MTAKTTDTLYLFSSDNRPLYVENCLAVLALPKGAIHRFRYQRRWVSLGTGDAEDSRWLSLSKAKTRVEIYFVASKSVAYGRAVYVPLRTGKVVRTFVEGDFFFVDFEVGGYLVTPEGAEFDDRKASTVSETDVLRGRLGVGRYPEADYGTGSKEGHYSAVLSNGQSTSDVAADARSSKQFVETARRLDDLLKSNDGRPTFMRLLGFRPAYPVSSALADIDRGTAQLKAGTEYQLDTLEFNADTAEGVNVRVALPTVLTSSSELTAKLASPYDVTSFRFVTAAKENDNRGEIVAELLPPDGVKVPRVRAHVPVVVQPRWAFNALNIAVIFFTGVASLLLTLGSLKGIIFEKPADESAAAYWVLWSGTSYVALVPGVLAVAVAAAVAAMAAAAGAVFRRRFGLDSK